jgi:serine/threonine protein kinase
MDDPSIRNPAYQALTDQQLSEIDTLCDRFDQQLVKGDCPRIETFLVEASEAARDGLLAELLSMEIEYRSKQGDEPQRGEYIPRFPEQRSLITGVFTREATAEFSGNDTTSIRAIVPTDMGNFRLIEQIGHGGMGIVLRAHDKKLKRDVAIKVLAPHLAGDAEAVQRFVREAQSAAAVRHDNIVTIHAVDEANGSPFLVMELINGESLQGRMKHGPLPVDDIVQLGIQIASGLEAAHRCGLIHRDIKPANILLENAFVSSSEPEGTPGLAGSPDTVRAKITDFGLARVMSESAMTRSGLIAGTPLYMSPEQANGEPADHRSDLFSLGSVLYSLCTGQVAFPAESAIAVLRRVIDHEPEPVRSLNPAIPDWLCEVIAKLMAKQPENRIQTAKEVADLLTRRQAQGHEGLDGPTTAHTLPLGQSVTSDASLSRGASAPGQSVKASADVSNERPEANSPRLANSNVAPQGSSRGPMTFTLHRTLIILALLASVVLAVVFSRGRDPRQTDLDFTATNPLARHQSDGVSHDAAKAPQRAIAPFNNEQARQHQEAWAAHLSLPVEFTNTIGMRFRLIPPGEFLMGCTPEEIDAELKRPELDLHSHFWRTPIEGEGPQHKVVLTKPIYVGVTEVTQAQYELVMGTNPSQFSSTGEGKEAVANLETGNYPVEMVSFNESVEFCAKLSQHEQLEPFNVLSDQTVTTLEGTGYRLPTEAEWEFACRAGTTTRFWSGDENEDLIQAGWCSCNAGGRTHAVGELKANPFGLSDMHGNVWEWVQDGWDPKFYGQFQENVATDPFSPLSAGTMPMRRGGSFMQVPELVRSSSRLLYHTDNEMGFREVLVVGGLRVSDPGGSPQSNDDSQSEVPANDKTTPDPAP